MTQPRRHRRSRRKRQGNFAFLYRLLTFVMICGAIVAALSLFFKADQIFVTGTSRYSQQQVLQASGIRQGGNLFLLNKHQAAAAITDQLPYVESVRIRRQLPNALRIEITECTHPLALEQDGALWLLNGNGKLIDKLQPGQGESCPLVTGLTLTSPSWASWPPGKPGQVGPAAAALAAAARQGHGRGCPVHRPDGHRPHHPALSGPV